MPTPSRQIRAVYDDSTITVYQAYGGDIADPALEGQRFVGPFERGRMTWIKPSFLWMMYRSGWGSKQGQTRVLAVSITREGFEWALANSCPSHAAAGGNDDEWRRRLAAAPVRIQWDPERDIRMRRLEHRSIQIGLSGEAVGKYLDEWIKSITDVTGLAHRIAGATGADRLSEAEALLPRERPYPLPDRLATVVHATPSA